MHASVARITSVARKTMTNGNRSRQAPNGSDRIRNKSTAGVIATRMIWKNQILGKLNQPSARYFQLKTCRDVSTDIAACRKPSGTVAGKVLARFPALLSKRLRREHKRCADVPCAGLGSDRYLRPMYLNSNHRRDRSLSCESH